MVEKRKLVPIKLTVSVTVFEFYGNYCHCYADQFPDKNTIYPIKMENPMSMRDIRTRDHQHMQDLKDQAYNGEIIREKIGKPFSHNDQK